MGNCLSTPGVNEDFGKGVGASAGQQQQHKAASKQAHDSVHSLDTAGGRDAGQHGKWGSKQQQHATNSSNSNKSGKGRQPSAQLSTGGRREGGRRGAHESLPAVWARVSSRGGACRVCLLGFTVVEEGGGLCSAEHRGCTGAGGDHFSTGTPPTLLACAQKPQQANSSSESLLPVEDASRQALTAPHWLPHTHTPTHALLSCNSAPSGRQPHQ